MIAECANLRRCVAWDRHLLTAAWTVDAPLCEGCVNRGAHDIAALAADHRALTAELTPAGPGPTEHTSGGDTEARTPVALAVDELRRGIAWTLTTWEPAVREAAGLPGPVTAGVRPDWAVRTAARLLAGHAWTLAGLPPTWCYAEGLDAGPVERDGVFAMASLRALHLAADRAVGATALTRAEPGLCQACGAPALSRVDGSDTVSCSACDHRLTYDDYRRYVGLIVDQHI